MRDYNHTSTFDIRWKTYVQEWREASWKPGEIRKAAQRRHGASSIRILVHWAFLLPVIPDLINHLRGRVVR